MSLDNQRKFTPFEVTAFIKEQGLQIIDGDLSCEGRMLSENVLKQLPVPDRGEQYLFGESLGDAKRYLSKKRIKYDMNMDFDHRRSWRTEVTAKYGQPVIDFFEYDKYRLNTLAQVYRSIRNVFMLIRRLKDVPLKAQLITLSNSRPDLNGYDNLTNEEKDIFVQKVDEWVKTFINIVST